MYHDLYLIISNTQKIFTDIYIEMAPVMYLLIFNFDQGSHQVYKKKNHIHYSNDLLFEPNTHTNEIIMIFHTQLLKPSKFMCSILKIIITLAIKH